MRYYIKQKLYQKHIVCLYIILLSAGTMVNIYFPQEQITKAAAEEFIIPDEAIRLRILANSDSKEDQETKLAIRDAVNKEISRWVADLTSIDEARGIISSRLTDVEKIVDKELTERQANYTAQIKFGNVQFPTKVYGQYLYPAGIYEAIIITLGEGNGENWWCVLYPPLCFLDFTNSAAIQPAYAEEMEEPLYNYEENVDEELEAVDRQGQEELQEQQEHQVSPYVAEPEDEVEVKFFIKEIVDKWL